MPQGQSFFRAIVNSLITQKYKRKIWAELRHHRLFPTIISSLPELSYKTKSMIEQFCTSTSTQKQTMVIFEDNRGKKTLSLSNNFQFQKAGYSSGITVLNAILSDFSCGRHAHEELSIGVTTEGVQEFFCDGRTFRSHPGDIILFNPGEVHTGNPGTGEDALPMIVRDYIHDNIQEDITIDDLSHVANISKFHLIRIFRRQLGLTPHKYSINHRINPVRNALKGGLSATHVAHEFGFFDTSHLNRHFKQAYGVTPAQYQTQIQG